jgi:hypothetical protein
VALKDSVRLRGGGSSQLVEENSGKAIHLIDIGSGESKYNIKIRFQTTCYPGTFSVKSNLMTIKHWIAVRPIFAGCSCVNSFDTNVDFDLYKEPPVGYIQNDVDCGNNFEGLRINDSLQNPLMPKNNIVIPAD